MNADFLEAPVYRSLTEVPTVFGMPRKVGLLLGFLTLIMTVTMSQWWFIPVAFGVMFLFRVMGKKDAYFFEIWTSLLKLPEVMD